MLFQRVSKLGHPPVPSRPDKRGSTAHAIVTAMYLLCTHGPSLAYKFHYPLHFTFQNDRVQL